jgi:hypothetical protein
MPFFGGFLAASLHQKPFGNSGILFAVEQGFLVVASPKPTP